jgi:hypothetical protein
VLRHPAAKMRKVVVKMLKAIKKVQLTKVQVTKVEKVLQEKVARKEPKKQMNHLRKVRHIQYE